MESLSIEESKGEISKEEYLNSGWRGHYLTSPNLNKPVIDEAPFYSKFEDLKDVSTSKCKLKFSENPAEAYPEYTLIDVKLDARGAREDEQYISFIDILKNIRRGNTYIKDDDGVTILRKGMIKFYDITQDMLKDSSETMKGMSGTSRKAMDSKKEITQMNIILAGPYSTLQAGHKVEVIKTLKANGENAQISYSSKYDSWVFCSKNVALLAKNKDDVLKYQGHSNQRYAFA